MCGRVGAVRVRVPAWLSCGAQISRGRILPFFNEIFDGLCKLAADPDLNVKNGAQLLDRLMKDIVIESNVFEVEKFIPLLRVRPALLLAVSNHARATPRALHAHSCCATLNTAHTARTRCTPLTRLARTVCTW